MRTQRAVLPLMLLALVPAARLAAAEAPMPLKVFILAGQSNPEDSPNPGHGHHEFGNAETYLLVGDALGHGMRKLLTKAPAGENSEPARPTSHTVRQLQGWTVRVDDRLLQPPNEELGRRALRFLENKLADIKAV